MPRRNSELELIEPGDTVELSTGELAIFFSDAAGPGYGHLVGAGRTSVVNTEHWIDDRDRAVVGLAPLGHELSIRNLKDRR